MPEYWGVSNYVIPKLEKSIILAATRYQCIVYCKGSGGSTGEIRFKVSAGSANDAERYLKSEGLNRICRKNGYSAVGGGFAGDGVYCRY